jgi:hypothetical protein
MDVIGLNGAGGDGGFTEGEISQHRSTIDADHASIVATRTLMILQQKSHCLGENSQDIISAHFL